MKYYHFFARKSTVFFAKKRTPPRDAVVCHSKNHNPLTNPLQNPISTPFLSHRILFPSMRWFLLILSLGFILAARIWNSDQVFVDGQIYFVDADCYSRMTRVAAVLDQPGTVLRHHDFENWPIGTTPHTTLPLDYLIACVAVILKPFFSHSTDLAGAVTPLFLALAAGFILWWWAAPFRLTTQLFILLLFAWSPILVHGTLLGRPDHQSLLIFLLILAWTTGQRLHSSPSRTLALLNGVAWGLALWTSLFEPAILLAITILGSMAAFGKKTFHRFFAESAITTGFVLLIALAIEHWRISALPRGPLFERWSLSIGELAAPGLFSSLYLQWNGLILLALPAFLFWQIFRHKNRPAISSLLLLTATWLLTATAVRWGYFFALAVIFALPFLLEKWTNRWLLAAFFLGFWPMASEWETRIFPSQTERERLAEQREDYRQLRQIATHLPLHDGFLAPWWLSPPLAYWSGANGLAGSSHQSLPGIEATAQFYLSRFPEKTRGLLQHRQISWVLAYEPSRVLSTSSSLLGISAANDALAIILYEQPQRAPSFLKLAHETSFFKLYRVAPTP